jgi:hypothetical protein
MKHFWSIGILNFVVAFVALGFGQTAVKPGEKQFAEGRQLIQANCVDCMGGSRAGMEQGIHEIEEAIEAGYPNKTATYKLLLNAYTELDTYTEKDPPAHQISTEKRSQVLKKLVEISPRDPEVLQSYADSLQDPDQKAVVLAKMIALNPNLTDARYELGLITARKGKTGEGIAEGIQMVEHAITSQRDPDAVRAYAQGLINLLDEVKCPLRDPEQWNTHLNQAYDKATQGVGNPAALADFKKGFLEAVGKQPCASVSK